MYNNRINRKYIFLNHSKLQTIGHHNTSPRRTDRNGIATSAPPWRTDSESDKVDTPEPTIKCMCTSDNIK